MVVTLIILLLLLLNKVCCVFKYTSSSKTLAQLQMIKIILVQTLVQFLGTRALRVNL